MILFYIIIIGCRNNASESNKLIPPQSFTNVTALEADSIIRKNSMNTDFIIIDLRSPVHYYYSHIERAINIPYKPDQFKEKIKNMRKEATYLVYYYGGCKRSRFVEIMKRENFRTVIHLLGGFEKWKSLGLSVEMLPDSHNKTERNK